MSNTKSEPTKVIFRKYKDTGEILAIFPYEIWSWSGSVMCYEHIGQHSSGQYEDCIDLTRPAKPNEYKKLQKELQRIGYTNLKIISKRNYNSYLKAKNNCCLR